MSTKIRAVLAAVASTLLSVSVMAQSGDMTEAPGSAGAFETFGDEESEEQDSLDTPGTIGSDELSGSPGRFGEDDESIGSPGRFDEHDELSGSPGRFGEDDRFDGSPGAFDGDSMSGTPETEEEDSRLSPGIEGSDDQSGSAGIGSPTEGTTGGPAGSSNLPGDSSGISGSP